MSRLSEIVNQIQSTTYRSGSLVPALSVADSVALIQQYIDEQNEENYEAIENIGKDFDDLMKRFKANSVPSQATLTRLKLLVETSFYEGAVLFNQRKHASATIAWRHSDSAQKLEELVEDLCRI